MNVKEIKRLSNFLSKNTDMKQSSLLELFAQYEGYNNWNTFVGIENQSDSIDSIEWDDAEFYEDIDLDERRTGYLLKYNFKKSILFIKISGRSMNRVNCIFHVNLKDMKKCLLQYNKLKSMKKEVIPNKHDSDIMDVLYKIDDIFKEEEKRKSECILCEHGFRLRNSYAEIHVSNREIIENFFERMVNFSKNIK